MRTIREILRLRWGEEWSYAAIAQSVGVGHTAVFNCVLRAEAAGLRWPLDPSWDDATLEAKLYPGGNSRRPMAEPDFAWIHRELRRKHVTLQLLWQEYKQGHPEDGYHYSQFCDLYSRFRRQLNVVMRQTHRAGEKTFVDFSGDGIDIVDPDTGEVTEAPLFVCALGASSFTYAEVLLAQDLSSWIQGHIHAFEFFGGVTALVVPDNTKTAVTRPCYYEPDLNPTYLEMARHYNTTILPTRVAKARDKAKVESAVLVAQRWILAALRNHRFFSVAQAQEAVALKLEELNERKFQKLDASRRQLYEQIDRPALQPLPPTRYEFAEWFTPRVNIDCHVDVGKHYYSVPYPLVHNKLDARMSGATVEIFFKGSRVASHARSRYKGGYTTLKEHLPPAHQRHLEWSPERVIQWAGQTGPATRGMAEAILASRPHPEQGYRACLGLMRLGKAHGASRLEAACARALAAGAHSYRSVESILKKGLDRQPLEAVSNTTPLIQHGNVRGPQYYH